jgi:hypothetical protein
MKQKETITYGSNWQASESTTRLLPPNPTTRAGTIIAVSKAITATTPMAILIGIDIDEPVVVLL